MRDKRTNCEFMPAGGWTAALNKLLCNRPRGPLRYPRDRGTNCEFMPAAAWTVALEEIPRNRPRERLRCARDSVRTANSRPLVGGPTTLRIFAAFAFFVVSRNSVRSEPRQITRLE